MRLVGDNGRMEIQGVVQNGVVVLDGNASLPEGAAVTVSILSVASSDASPPPVTQIVCAPGKLPYVHGGVPGSWNLTNEMIGQILEEEDIAMMKGRMIDPS